MKYTDEEGWLIRKNIREYGGSFAKALGHAYEVADYRNKKIIEDNFSELLDKYLNFKLKEL